MRNWKRSGRRSGVLVALLALSASCAACSTTTRIGIADTDLGRKPTAEEFCQYRVLVRNAVDWGVDRAVVWLSDVALRAALLERPENLDCSI